MTPFVLIAVLYAFAEGTFANWAAVFLHEERGVAEGAAALSLSVFWAALVGGRLLVSALVLRVRAERVWLTLPLLMVLSFLLLPSAHDAASGALRFALAGLSCGAFFPLTVGQAIAAEPRSAAQVSSLLTAALMLGSGVGSFAIGALRDVLRIEHMYLLSSVYPLLAWLFAAESSMRLARSTSEEIERDIRRDPLVASARILVEAGLLTPDQVLARYEQKRSEVLRAAAWAETRAALSSADEVMEPIAPRRPHEVAVEAARHGSAAARLQLFDAKLPEQEGAVTLALAINRTLTDLLAKYPELLVFGEDVGRKGGVYGVTRGLLKKAGAGRVFDTVLDEQSVLGLALGAAVTGLYPSQRSNTSPLHGIVSMAGDTHRTRGRAKRPSVEATRGP